MYNSETPLRAELPSSGQLLRSTVLAAVAAGVLLATVVLPAEYGIDPTGVGRVLGLTEMGEIKTRLAAEARAEAAAAPSPAAPATSAPEAQAATAPSTQPTPPATPAPAEALSAVTWRDEMSFTLAPGVGTIDKTPGREHMQSTAEEGYLYTGPAGSGHFVKMVHNGIEYGLMQAYGEGLDILKGVNQASIPAERRYDLDLADITELWRRGSVVSSWLLDLSAIALAEDPELKAFTGRVDDSGEGRWTIQAAIEEAVPADVLTAALYTRFRSRQDHTFAEKVLSAMRKQFGGHQESKS